MALTKITDMSVPGNVEAVRHDLAIDSAGDAGDLFFGLNPRKHTSIHVQKPTDGGKVFLTNSAIKLDGSGRIITPDDADIIWRERSTGTDEFFAGDEKGLTGMKYESDIDPTTVLVKISILQMQG